jgi:hypothetical protein
MTATSTPAPAVAPPLPETPGRWQRWSDRLNPILVREVQQAVKGRLFVLTVWGALTIAVAIAAVIASHYEPGGRSGRDAFHAGFATLMPLLVFVVPMQAYQSMRLEMRAGIVEQLLLSRLRPMHILLGKLQAAMVQFVVYVAVLAPLLATSYLLRGVDVPTIAISLFFAALACATATAFAVSSAAQAVLQGFQTIANLATAFGLGMAAFSCVGVVASGEYSSMVGWLLRASEFWAVISAILLVAAVACTLSLLIARSFLVHAFENKATPFRVLLFVLPVLAFGWVRLFLAPRNWQYAIPVLTYVLLLVGMVFGLMMVTEQAELSPRLRAHAPRTRLGGLFAAPFLPGRDRGMSCVALFVAVLAGFAALVWPATSSYDTSLALHLGVLTLAYAAAWLALGRWLRGFLPAGLQGNHVARFVVPALFFVGMLLPTLFDVFARGRVDQWHVGHVLNPFWTISEVCLGHQLWEPARTTALLVIGGVALLQLPVFARGVREVWAAGSSRPPRHADG